MIDAIVTRLKAQVSDFNGRVEGAAFLAELLSQNRLPQGVGAVVVPVALQGQSADAGSGIFRQPFAETIAVLLLADVRDRYGKAALTRIRPLIVDVMQAIAGWTPGDELGVFELRGGRLVSMQGGRFAYQIEFTIMDQLRIAS